MLAAKRATSQRPVVFRVGDPVALGSCQSLARPGGNMTGISFDVSSRSYMRSVFSFSTEAVPTLRHVALLASSEFPQPRTRQRLRAAAAQRDWTSRKSRWPRRPVGCGCPQREGTHGAPTPEHLAYRAGYAFRQQLADLAPRASAAISPPVRERPIGWGPYLLRAEPTRYAKRGAVFVDKILKGTKP